MFLIFSDVYLFSFFSQSTNPPFRHVLFLWCSLTIFLLFFRCSFIHYLAISSFLFLPFFPYLHLSTFTFLCLFHILLQSLCYSSLTFTDSLIISISFFFIVRFFSLFALVFSLFSFFLSRLRSPGLTNTLIPSYHIFWCQCASFIQLKWHFITQEKIRCDAPETFSGYLDRVDWLKKREEVLLIVFVAMSVMVMIFLISCWDFLSYQWKVSLLWPLYT